MSGANTVKCKCGRSFKTVAAMKQHKASGSCKSGTAPVVQRQRAQKVPVPSGAPVAQAVTVRETSSDSAIVAGVDRITHIENVQQFGHGTVVVDELLSSSSFARLARVAGAYQKVRYRKLTFRIVPMMSTATGGGYVAAFVRDPSDVPPSNSLDLLNWVTSQQGSVTTKWWQTADIAVGVADRTYYTSSSEEVREYSPGRLVVVVDGKATAQGPMTVFADWSVVLTHASLESAVGPDRSDHTVVLRNLWTKDTNQYVWSYDPTKTDTTGSPNPDLMFSDWRVGDLFMLPASFSVEEYKSGVTGDAEVGNFWVLHVESVTGVRWRVHPDTKDSQRVAAEAVLVIPRGFTLRRVEQASSLQGNLMTGPQSSSTRSNGTCWERLRGPLPSSLKRSEAPSSSVLPHGVQQPDPQASLLLGLDTLRESLMVLQPFLPLLTGALATQHPGSSRRSSFDALQFDEPASGASAAEPGP